MKIVDIIKLDEKFPQCDVTTETENYYIKAGNTYILSHNSPALQLYSQVEGYPDNGIGLKSLVSNPANAITRDDQIRDKYGDRPDMALKLHYGLQLAPSIPDGEIWQGDCLYSKEDLREVEINGKTYLTFHPNKIVYAISEDNESYEQIKNSDFGICLHTIYKDGGQSFNVDPERLYNVPGNIYVMSPAIDAASVADKYDLEGLQLQYSELQELEQKLLDNPAYEELCDNSFFMSYWNTFENANLSDKASTTLNVSTFLDDLREYIQAKMEKEYTKKMGTLKTDKSKQSATDKYNSDLQKVNDILENNKQVLIDLVNCLNKAATIKMSLWAVLRQVNKGYDSFYKHRERGYIPADMEGISMSDMDGNIVKIVDRSTFSNANRDPNYMSGFEHESLEEGLKPSTPYMLRNDGALLECGNYHPYISDIYADKGDDLISLVQERLPELKWFYDNTLNKSTKNLISILYKSTIQNNMAYSGYENELGITNNTYASLGDEIYSFLELLANEVNQEFCRVRTSDIKYGGNSGDTYFRISSTGFNWFPIIWKVVMDNPMITSVTISKDLSARDFKQGECYKVGGVSIDHLPREEFLAMKGNPVVENYTFDREDMNEAILKLNSGKSISESLPDFHPRYINRYFRTMKKCQLPLDLSCKLQEDTEKKKNGKWVNKGKDGEHGEFKTKKAADAQRRAMFANGFHEDYSSFGDIDD